MLDENIGRIVYSKSGRDKDKMLVIVGVLNSNLIVLADGDTRKIESPKVKNVKHVAYTAMIAQDVVDSFKRGEIPDNQTIKKNLRKILEARDIEGKEVW